MKIQKFSNVLTLIGIILLTLNSCSNDCVDCAAINPQKVAERVDVKLQGDEVEYFYNQSLQEDVSSDLVRYNFYGNSSSDIDYIIQLGENKILTVKLHNSAISNPWAYKDSYGTFPAQELGNKFKYVTIELEDMTSSESITYVSNIGEEVPRGGLLDVFRIENYDINKSDMLCRINRMKLYQRGFTENSITIDGTFRGSLTFLE